MKIASKSVGDGHPVFIIAEAGVNHNGSVELAKKLIDIARDAGADAVKFQTFRACALITSQAKKAAYQMSAACPSESQYALLRKLELSAGEFRELAGYCRKKNIIFLSSPFDVKSLSLLVDIGVPAIKIASGEITNFPLLRKAADAGRPTILSTGMSTLTEVADAVEVLRRSGAQDVLLLHCTSEYPARFEDVNLRAMVTMREAFNLPIGLSDHTPGTIASIAAVAMGACAIEKHFTISKSLPGPDHKASLSPEELRRLIEEIRNVELALGDGKKVPRPGEDEIRCLVRKSVVAAKDILAGTAIARDMLTIKRPGTGLEPKHIGEVLGKTAKRTIRKEEVIALDMIG